MANVGIIGLGKMGLSHFSIVNAHPDVTVVGVCDSSSFVLDVLGKYTGVATFTDMRKMLDSARPDAVVIATPSKFHAPMVRECLERDIDVFCEKPFCLDPTDSFALASLARERGLVTQVGYHNRFVATFAEVKRLLELKALGRITHVLAEAYGPVVLKPKGGTWRSKKDEGGGALYDYAAHPVDLLTWFFGRPESVAGTVLGRVYSTETEDEVFTTLKWPTGVSGQLSVSWSDESLRKMTTRVSIWGTNGKVFADRQEIQVYLRGMEPETDGYGNGWTVRYTTELTEDVGFYVRGEEYSSQIDAWLSRVAIRAVTGTADFIEANVTDETLFTIRNSADGQVHALSHQSVSADSNQREKQGLWSRARRRLQTHGSRTARKG